MKSATHFIQVRRRPGFLKRDGKPLGSTVEHIAARMSRDGSTLITRGGHRHWSIRAGKLYFQGEPSTATLIEAKRCERCGYPFVDRCIRHYVDIVIGKDN